MPQNTKTHYDVIIIGAGINGVGVAHVLSAQGKRVLVLEKAHEAGNGTSSKSSKLVHGGLRYLEYGELRLVWESLSARNQMLRTLPDLVKRQRFYIPLYNHSTRPAWKVWAGLALYFVLSGFNKHSLFKRIPKNDWHLLDGLQTNDLKAVWQYYDAQTDDKALTQKILQQAKQQGAQLKLQQTILQIQQHPVHVAITCQDQSYTAQAVVNAAGPWVNEVLALCEPPCTPTPLSLVQGTHIVIDRPTRAGCFYVEAPTDNRAVFVMPWKNNTTLIGTTELLRNHPDDCVPTQAEKTYLLDTYNHYFGTMLSSHDIVEAMAGLRVLPQVTGNASASSREVRIISQGSIVSIYGGKLTTWQATAKKVHKALAKIRS